MIKVGENLNREGNISRIVDSGVIAIIKIQRSEEVLKIARAIKDGGVDVIEVSAVTPGALDAIKMLHGEYGDEVLIGVGTVLDPETTRAAIICGAEFVIGPTLNREVIEMCKRYSKISIPGALTPTEILTAWEAGADLVKVFPAVAVGPRYFRDVLGPLPQVRLIATGGINLENAGEFLSAGSVAVAAGGALVDKNAVMEGNFKVIEEKARGFIEVVRGVRSQKGK